MTDSPFAYPCSACAEGRHDQCVPASLCGCLADHADDPPIVGGFKKLKRQLHPEREVWVRGGWTRPPIRVGEATVGKPPEGTP